MEVHFIVRCIVAFILALGLAFHGLKKKSLDISGSAAAIFVGFTAFACSYRFGLILILFYYSSSKLTKVREDIKVKLEDNYQQGGQRNWIQVFANSIFATIIAVIYFMYIGEDQPIISSKSTELIVIWGFKLQKSILANQLWAMYISHYGCAAGDTWASEVGILSTTKPRLVTSFFTKTVPKGTNGGMSILGTLASAVGGGFIGLIFFVYHIMFISDNPSTPPQYPIIIIGFLSGIIGSLIDSILGATLQSSYYSIERNMIIKDVKQNKKSDIQLICGMDVLTNELVNFISIAITMLLTTIIVPFILS